MRYHGWRESKLPAIKEQHLALGKTRPYSSDAVAGHMVGFRRERPGNAEVITQRTIRPSCRQPIHICREEKS